MIAIKLCKFIGHEFHTNNILNRYLDLNTRFNIDVSLIHGKTNLATNFVLHEIV